MLLFSYLKENRIDKSSMTASLSKVKKNNVACFPWQDIDAIHLTIERNIRLQTNKLDCYKISHFH